MFATIWNNISQQHPLVHCITNYVTVNQCANTLLAVGGSPVMADEPADAADIAAISNAVVLNIGTLNARTIPAMFCAGEAANAAGHPVVLDPVGAGASGLRTKTTQDLLAKLQFAVVRGNISEIKTVALGSGTTKGVDADVADEINEQSLPAVIALAQQVARDNQTVVAITGPIDVVADQDSAYVIRNGHPAMSRITGSGCMLTCLVAAAVAANPTQILAATAAAVAAMGLAGQQAAERMLQQGTGNATFSNDLIDALSHLNGDMLEQGARYEVY